MHQYLQSYFSKRVMFIDKIIEFLNMCETTLNNTHFETVRVSQRNMKNKKNMQGNTGTITRQNSKPYTIEATKTANTKHQNPSHQKKRSSRYIIGWHLVWEREVFSHHGKVLIFTIRLKRCTDLIMVYLHFIFFLSLSPFFIL